MGIPGITEGPHGPLRPPATPTVPPLEEVLRQVPGLPEKGPAFIVFGTQTCPWCTRTRDFLDALRDGRPAVQVVDVDANERPDLFWAVAHHSGRRTVPQIFLDGNFVGGWRELADAARLGRLDAYLDGHTRLDGPRG